MAKCPILKMPKPEASLFGFGKGELGFFRLPDYDFKLETPDPSPIALIKVSGGQIGAEVVQTELAHLITKDWVWEALPHSEDSFLVSFPSVEELKRMADIDFRLRNHGVTLTILEWDDAREVLPSYHLDEVWVHVTGVPHAWRHYLGFWALGSVIGVTLDVDMLTYRKKGVIRLLVGMMSRELLPFSTDIVCGKFGYDIVFSVEKSDFVPVALPITKEDPSNGGDGGLDKGNNPNGDNPDQIAKKLKNSVAPSGSNPSPSAGDSSFTPMQLAVVPSGRRPVQRFRPIVSDGARCLPEMAVKPKSNTTAVVLNVMSLKDPTPINSRTNLLGRCSTVQRPLVSMVAQPVLNLPLCCPRPPCLNSETAMVKNPVTSSLMQTLLDLRTDVRNFDFVPEAVGMINLTNASGLSFRPENSRLKDGKCMNMCSAKLTSPAAIKSGLPSLNHSPVVGRMTGRVSSLEGMMAKYSVGHKAFVPGNGVPNMSPRLPGSTSSNGHKNVGSDKVDAVSLSKHAVMDTVSLMFHPFPAIRVSSLVDPTSSTASIANDFVGMDVDMGEVQNLGTSEPNLKDVVTHNIPSSPTAQLVHNPANGSSPADDDITLKAMRRASARNLDGSIDGVKESAPKKMTYSAPFCPQQIGYPFGGLLALQLGYSPAGGLAGVGCGWFATVGASGKVLFLPGSWVAI